MAWFRKSPETARDMGRIVAEEAAKLGEYNVDGETLVVHPANMVYLRKEQEKQARRETRWRDNCEN